ncbi:histidine kinase [Isoptericola halotolerans]|uniref:sensor histidine kinase n=1 Tax=Isoptericola halotolerans TaxID=300560 RepID=UPI0031DDC1DC
MQRTLGAIWNRPSVPGAPPPRRADVALVAVLVVCAVLEGVLRTDLTWPVASVAVTVAVLCVLPWRRTHPVAAVAAGTVVGSTLEITQHAAGLETVGMITQAALILLPYALYRWGSGPAIVVGTVLLVTGAAVSVVTGWSGPGDAIGGAVVLVLAMSIGETVRQRVTARARLLEEARARERERIARDLHDTVAHHVSAIAVRAQAGQVAPETAIESLGVIETEARRALAEMRFVVGALRDDGSPALQPAPGMDDLTTLAADDGVRAVVVRVDAMDALDDATGTALYRVAQESVANARRHARGATCVDVVVEADGDDVRMRVHDDGAATAPGHGGFGLVGMAERAAALGGTCTAGPDPAGGWTVDLTLPAGRARLPR